MEAEKTWQRHKPRNTVSHQKTGEAKNRFFPRAFGGHYYSQTLEGQEDTVTEIGRDVK